MKCLASFAAMSVTTSKFNDVSIDIFSFLHNGLAWINPHTFSCDPYGLQLQGFIILQLWWLLLDSPPVTNLQWCYHLYKALNNLIMNTLLYAGISEQNLQVFTRYLMVMRKATNDSPGCWTHQ